MSTGSALAVQQDWHEQHRTHEASAGWRFRLNSLTERFPAHKGIAKNASWELEPNTAQANALRSAKLWTIVTARHSASPPHRQLQLERAARSLQREPLELGCQALPVALHAWHSPLWNAQMPQASCAFKPVLLSTCWLSGRDLSSIGRNSKRTVRRAEPEGMC